MKNLFSIFSKKRNTENDKTKKPIILKRPNFNQSKSQNLNDEIERFHRIKVKEAHDEGIKIGRRVPPRPTPEEKDPPNFERKLQKDYQSQVDKLNSWGKSKVEESENKYSEEFHQYQDYKNDKDGLTEQIKAQVEEKKQIDLENLESSFEKQRNDIDERIEEAKLKKEHSKGNLDEIEDQLELIGEPVPSKKPLYYYLFLLLLGALEFPLNEVVFQAMRESFFLTVLMSLGISILIPITAHVGGHYAKAKKESIKDYVFLSLPILTAIILSLIVGYVRNEYLLEKEVRILSVYGLAFLNMAFFVVGFLLSYHYSYKNPELVKHYFKTKKDFQSNENELRVAKQEKEQLDELLGEKKKEIIDRYEGEIRDRTDNYYSNKRKAILKTSNELNYLISSIKSLEELINSYYLQAINEFRHSNTQRRADGKIPKCFQDEPEPLNLKFRDYEKREPFFEKAKTPTQYTKKTRKKPVRKSTLKNKSILKSTATFLFLAVSFSFFLLGCQQKEYARTLVYVAVDKTGSYEIPNPLTSLDVLDISGINTEINNSCVLYTTDINDVSINNIQKTTLGKGSFYENEFDRQDEISIFISEADSILNKTFLLEEEKKKSSIYLPLCNILKCITSDSADQKVLFIYSDMFENNRSQTLSFYDYSKNPSGLLESFEKIKHSLESVEKLPDLSGVDIKVIFTPSVQTDDLYVYARKFWERYLTSKNANISFVANI